MNAKFLFPLIAATSLVACVATESVPEFAAPPVSTTIVDLPTISVFPAAEDLAYYRANRVVDLAAISVQPEPEDLAFYLARRNARIVDMPMVRVRPDVEDVQIASVERAMRVNHIAAR